MSESPKLTEYRYLAANETLKEMLADIERRHFDRFMARPWFLRFRRAGQGDIARIDAVREIRRELDFHAKQPVARKPVV